MPALACNSCNTSFADDTQQRSHYRSDWHRYNLKRRVADLPGVTEESFEKRKQALLPNNNTVQKVVYCCKLCGKQYNSEKAYETHIRSRLHLSNIASHSSSASELTNHVPVLRPIKEKNQTKPLSETPSLFSRKENGGMAVDYVKINSDEGKSRRVDHEVIGKGVMEDKVEDADADADADEDEDEDEDEEDDWEEVNEDDIVVQELSHMNMGSSGEEVDKERRNGNKEEEKEEKEEVGENDWNESDCIFCKETFHGDVDACVSHMHSIHGFFIPDVEFLVDLNGLLKYLGLKVSTGFMCLVCDDRGRQFSSLDAVRKHMITKCHCKLRYGDGSGMAEEELEEFYDFSSSYGGVENMQLALREEGENSHVSLSETGLELIISSEAENGGRSTKTVGSREFARYYRQKHKPSETRDGVLINTIIARYRSMGLATRNSSPWFGKRSDGRDSGVKASVRAELFRSRVAFKHNVTWNLPKNVTY